MNSSDEEPKEGDEGEEDKVGETEVEGERTISLEKLRETIRQIVDDAIKDALELRGRSRAVRMTMAQDMARLGREIRRAVEGAVHGASKSVYALDLQSLKKGLAGRTNTVMTRLRNEDVKRMDILVESGLFDSRSACAAYLIHAGLEARGDLVEKVQDTAKRIGDLKEQLKQELSGEGPET